MKNDNMASFICELRKSKNLTQKQLAEQLNITDKAVSKWERGLGYPDITILAKLSEILGVTTNELLNGKKEDNLIPTSDILIENTLKYADKVSSNKIKTSRKVIEILFTSSCILAILICFVCDLSIGKKLSWSLYPFGCITFAWLIIIQLIHFEKKKIRAALVSLTVLIIPFLFYIERIINTTELILKIGSPIALVSLIYFWVMYLLFTKTSINRWYLTSISLILLIPLKLVINLILAIIISPFSLNTWDVLAISVIAFISFILCLVGYLIRFKCYRFND